MTEQTNGSTQEQQEQHQQQTEEQKREQAALEAREAEEGFSAGFKKVRGEEPPADGDRGQQRTDATTDDETAGKTAVESEEDRKAREEAERQTRERQAEEDRKAAEAREWEAVPKVLRERLTAIEEGAAKRLRNIEGHIGGLNSKLDGALATARAAAERKGGSAAAPSEKQVEAALADPDAWARLKEDFPDWAGPVEAEFSALRQEMAALKGVDENGVKAAVSSGIELAEERAFIRLKHPDWKSTVKTDEFKSWLTSQPDDVKALAGSDSGDDAVKLLDRFSAHRQKVAADKAAADATRDKNRQRLERSVVPNGSPEAPSTGLSDEEAFNRGFKRGKGK